MYTRFHCSFLLYFFSAYFAGGKFIRYHRKLFRVRKRKSYVIRVRGTIKLIPGVSRRIRIYAFRRYRLVHITRRTWYIRVKGRSYELRWRGRLWYYRKDHRWHRLQQPRLTIRYKGKRRPLRRHYGKWVMRIGRSWARLTRRYTRYIHYHRHKRLLKKMPSGKYAVETRRGRWSLPRRVVRRGQRRE